MCGVSREKRRENGPLKKVNTKIDYDYTDVRYSESKPDVYRQFVLYISKANMP